jgi:DNA-binding LacI/PurR family transcriptional regulator
MRPTPREQLEIALRACKAPRTVARVYAGESVYETTRVSVDRAARELGYPPPPPITAPADQPA